MQYISHYQSPLGEILLAAEEGGLRGLWFAGQKYFARGLDPIHEEREVPVFTQTRRWLDDYFSGKIPDFTPPLCLAGTDFQRAVWEILLTIPYGRTVTYAEIGERLAAQRGLPHMSARAVGGAVGRNAVSIIVPCHRVVGRGGRLTGYAGGISKKVSLLALEGIDTGARPPAGGTAE